MAVVEDTSRIDVFERAGLPREGVAAWLGIDDKVTGDFRRDTDNFWPQWRIGAELLARLPQKSARSQAEASAAAAILERDREARARFLATHVETVYRRLTDNLTKFKRVEHLVRDAATVVPGLVPSEDQLAKENALKQQHKDGFEVDQGLLLSYILGHPVCGMHLCHAMLLPRPDAFEHARRFAERGKLEFEGASVERRGKAAFVTMRHPRFLNSEDESTVDGLETAIDVATLDRETDIAVLRGDTVEHPKYRGRRLFSAGINLTHLYHGKISYVWYIKRDMGLVNKLFRGVARADLSPDEMVGGSIEKPWMGVSRWLCHRWRLSAGSRAGLRARGQRRLSDAAGAQGGHHPGRRQSAAMAVSPAIVSRARLFFMGDVSIATRRRGGWSATRSRRSPRSILRWMP